MCSRQCAVCSVKCAVGFLIVLESSPALYCKVNVQCRSVHLYMCTVYRYTGVQVYSVQVHMCTVCVQYTVYRLTRYIGTVYNVSFTGVEITGVQCT